MDEGQRLLREVKARQQRDQEKGTVKRIQELQRQELEQIRVEERLQEDKRGCLGLCMCVALFYL